MLNNEFVKLRALELEDIDILYTWENDGKIWKVSNTLVPFSKYILNKYLESSHLDIYTTKQIRFVIEEAKTENVVGLVDLFEFDPFHSRIGIGIMIYDKKDRKKYLAYNTIELIKDYVFNTLLINQIYCNISVNNTASINLFKKNNFKITGKKINWIRDKDGFTDVLFMQIMAKGSL